MSQKEIYDKIFAKKAVSEEDIKTAVNAAIDEIQQKFNAEVEKVGDFPVKLTVQLEQMENPIPVGADGSVMLGLLGRLADPRLSIQVNEYAGSAGGTVLQVHAYLREKEGHAGAFLNGHVVRGGFMPSGWRSRPSNAF